jgi:fructokinase
MTKPTVVGTGLITLDVVYRGDSKVPLRCVAGGTCGNVLSVLAFLGWRAVPVSRLAPDRAGERVFGDLARWGVDTSMLSLAPVAPTPIIVERIRHRGGEVVHSFLFSCPCCGAMLPRYRAIRLPDVAIVTQAIAEPTVFFFDRPSPAAIRMAREYGAADVLVVFEPSSAGDERSFKAALEVADIVKYSEQRLGGLPTVRGKARLEIQTRGVDGLRYRRSDARKPGAWYAMPALPAGTVLDTAGAGDWCTAGLLSRLRGTKPAAMTDAQVQDALRYGQALAAWNCRFEGARGGMYEHSRDELEREVRSIVSGTKLRAEPEHVDIQSAKAPDSICPACDTKTTRTAAKTVAL